MTERLVEVGECWVVDDKGVTGEVVVVGEEGVVERLVKGVVVVVVVVKWEGREGVVEER